MVIQDVTGPALLSADGTRSNTIVVATFSEPVAPPTASAPASYTITNTAGGTLSISSAVLTNATNVILTTQARLPDQNYLLVVRNIRDVSPGANLVGPRLGISMIRSRPSIHRSPTTPGAASVTIPSPKAGARARRRSSSI
jgi:hypothetical protein